MVRRICALSGTLGLVLLMASAGSPGNKALAQEKKADGVKLPASPPPSLWAVANYDTDKGVLVLERQRQRGAIMTPYTTADDKDDKGKKEEPKGRGRAVNQFVEKAQVNFADLTVQTVAGKDVGEKDRKDKLPAGTIVIFTLDGKAVDPAFLAVFKPETLIVGKKTK